MIYLRFKLEKWSAFFWDGPKNGRSKIKKIVIFLLSANLKNDRHFIGMVQKKDDQNVKIKIFKRFKKYKTWNEQIIYFKFKFEKWSSYFWDGQKKGDRKT